MVQQPWKKRVVASAALLALWGVSLDAQALALGAITVRSALGEPLRAEIEVPQISSQEASTFNASVASPQAFRAAGVDYTPALSGARVSLHRRPNGQAYLRVAGDRPVNEPFLGIVIEASSSSGRVVRDYTMLVDPPGRAAPPPVTITQQPQVASPAAVPPSPAPVVQAPAADPSAPPSAAPSRPPVAAAEPPRRRVPAPAAAPSMAGEGGQVTVKRGDTAYRLASAHAPEGVSLDQMLVAMLSANPDAFIGGNVNRMKAGVVLNLPSAEQAAATPRPAARRAVVAQTRDFNAYRRGLAERSGATRMAAASSRASGNVQPQVQESRPAATPADRLTLSRGGAPSGSESTVAQSRQAQEQAERVAELNKNISELSRLQAASGTAPGTAATVAAAAASTPGIAVPTGAATTAPAAAAPAPAPAPAPTPAATSTAAPSVTASAAGDAAPVAAAAVASAPASAADNAATPSAAASAAEDAATAAAAATTAAASAPERPRVAPAPTPVAEPSFVDTLMENPLLPIAGAGLLALLAGFGVYRARQRKKDGAPLDSSFIESRLQPDSFFGASGGQRVNTKDGGASVSGSSSMAYSPSQLDAAGDVDPVAEADVYLAYGRDMQAEEILKEALRTHPGRVSIHRKLAEIYGKRRDARALEAVATEAYDVTKGEGPDWLAITALGSELEPANPLYQPGGAPTTRGAAPSRRTFGADTEPQTAQIHDPTLPVSASVPLDLDLDLDAAPVRAPEPSVAPVVAAVATVATTAPEPEAPIAAAPASLSVAPPPAHAPAPAPDPGAPLDFDLDLDFAPPSELGAPTRPPAGAALPAIDPTASTTNDAISGMIDFDMDALSVDPDSRSGGELKTEQPEDADEDPLGTKLSLAQEFHAIGDTEGARALVKEVIAEASGPMKVRAERFLVELN